MSATISFICPKRKCRHAWTEFGADTMRNRDCPECGAQDVIPVGFDDHESDSDDAAFWQGGDPEGPAFECAGFNDGTGFYCPLWGSEECDWECPNGGLA